jgi:hypothetical protein
VYAYKEQYPGESWQILQTLFPIYGENPTISWCSRALRTRTGQVNATNGTIDELTKEQAEVLDQQISAKFCTQNWYVPVSKNKTVVNMNNV